MPFAPVRQSIGCVTGNCQLHRGKLGKAKDENFNEPKKMFRQINLQTKQNVQNIFLSKQ